MYISRYQKNITLKMDFFYIKNAIKSPGNTLKHIIIISYCNCFYLVKTNLIIIIIRVKLEKT